jgi:hypothetical protein
MRLSDCVSRCALRLWNPDAAGEEILHETLLLLAKFRHNRLCSLNEVVHLHDSLGNHRLFLLRDRDPANASLIAF